jgi:hypothetical protein
MPQFVVTTPRMCCALLAAALLAAPSGLRAQGRADGSSRGESVVITAASVRVRTAPSISSLSIDEFAQGSVFSLAADGYQSADWLAVIVDGRIGYVPRFAAAARQRQSAAAPATPAPASRDVMQAGAPTPAPVAMVAAAPTATVRAPASAPAAVTPAPVVMTAAAPTPAPVAPARTTPVVASAAAPRAEVVSAAAPAPSVAASGERVEPAAAEPAAATPAADAPVFKARRTGLNLTAGVLGSATLIEMSGLPRAVHVSGASFIGVRYRMLGLYAAPDMGQGGGFRSTSLDGGASLDLIRLHVLRVTALGGYLRYSETTVPTDSTVAPVTRSLQGYTMGGMVSLPFIGPLRLAYRGQYDTVRDAGVPVHRVKHSVGLLF